MPQDDHSLLDSVMQTSIEVPRLAGFGWIFAGLGILVSLVMFLTFATGSRDLHAILPDIISAAGLFLTGLCLFAGQRSSTLILVCAAADALYLAGCLLALLFGHMAGHGIDIVPWIMAASQAALAFMALTLMLGLAFRRA